MSARFRFTLALAVVLCSLVRVDAGENPQQAFARVWEGQSVAVKRPLYTLVYNERGKLGNTHDARRDGLTVVTPSSGVYFQFDGRQGRSDVTATKPEEIFNGVRAAYEPDSLEIRSYRKVDPIVVHRYDTGVQLIVRSVRYGRDTLRLGLAVADADPDEVTSLTIKWPVPLSKSFTERPVVEGLIRQFIDIRPPS